MSFGLIRLTKFHLIARAASASKRMAPLSYSKSTVLIPLPWSIIKRQSAVIAMKIGTVIGPGGKMIKSIVDQTGVKINIDDDGIVSIMSRDHNAVDSALEIVKNLTRTIEIGETYTGPVNKVMDFGAFVEVFPGTEGLVHISNLAEGRVEKVTDVCKEGDIVTVKATGVDRRGKIQLSIKDV